MESKRVLFFRGSHGLRSLFIVVQEFPIHLPFLGGNGLFQKKSLDSGHAYVKAMNHKDRIPQIPMLDLFYLLNVGMIVLDGMLRHPWIDSDT